VQALKSLPNAAGKTKAGYTVIARSRRQDVSSKRGLPVTVRENVHQLIDTLPEDRLADVLDYLADLQDEDASIGSATKAAIEEGLNDIRSGRTISLSDYRRLRGL
jgi:hypothetical protein